MIPDFDQLSLRIALVLYGLNLVLLVGGLVESGLRRDRLSIVVFGAATLCLGLSIGIRFLTIGLPNMPITSPFESLLAVTFVAAICEFPLILRLKTTLPSLFVLPFICTALFYAETLPPTLISPLPLVLQSHWFAIHVICALITIATLIPTGMRSIIALIERGMTNTSLQQSGLACTFLLYSVVCLSPALDPNGSFQLDAVIQHKGTWVNLNDPGQTEIETPIRVPLKGAGPVLLLTTILALLAFLGSFLVKTDGYFLIHRVFRIVFLFQSILVFIIGSKLILRSPAGYLEQVPLYPNPMTNGAVLSPIVLSWLQSLVVFAWTIKKGFIDFLPDCRAIEASCHRSARLGFLAFTMLIVSGAVLADSAWGHYWGFDSKETWSLFTWLLYACYFHKCSTSGKRSKTTLFLLLGGSVLLLISTSLCQIADP